MRGSWRPNKDCNILTSPAPPNITVSRSRSPGLLNRGPGGPASLGHILIPASFHQLVSKLTGVPRAPSTWWWLSLPHLVSSSSDLQLNRGSRGPFLLGGGFLYHILSPTSLISNSIGGPKNPFCRVVAFSTTSCLRPLWSPTHWLPVFTELYNSSIAHSVSIPMASQTGICHFRRFWTVMFDHHQAEITDMQFRGHSLPVHQSMNVSWDFTLSHFVSQARLRVFFT